jgi:hypothetical protein
MTTLTPHRRFIGAVRQYLDRFEELPEEVAW